MSPRFIAGLMMVDAMARNLQKTAVEVPPEPPPLSKEEEIRLALAKARADMIDSEGPETRQQRRHRDRREAKALASYQRHQLRKKYK